MAKFESLESGEKYVKSADGYCLCVTGLGPDTNEEDLIDQFSEYGEVRNCVLNLDRRTGFVKGYCLLEYATAEQAKKCINS